MLLLGVALFGGRCAGSILFLNSAKRLPSIPLRSGFRVDILIGGSHFVDKIIDQSSGPQTA